MTFLKPCRLAHMLAAFGLLLSPFPAATAQEEPEAPKVQALYTVDDFVVDWSLKGMKLSPNGKHIVLTMPKGDQILLLFGNMIDQKIHATANLAFTRDQYPINMQWATDDRVVFTLRQKARVGRSKHYVWSEVLMSVKRDGTELKMLRTDAKGGGLRHVDNADVISLLREDPDHILIGKSRRRNWMQEYRYGSIDDVHKLNIVTGELSLYMKGPKISSFKFDDWYADHKGHIRFGYGYDRKDNSVMVIRGRGDEDWTVLSDNELFEEGKFSPLRFGSGDNEFYVLSSLATGRMAVYQFDIATGTLGDLVFAHDDYDVTGIIYSTDKGKVVAARYNDGGPKIHYLDEEYGKLRDRIGRALKTGFSLWSKSDDDNAMIILKGDERDAGTYYFYDVPKRKMNYLGARVMTINPIQMAPMESVVYDTRDGLTIEAVVTKPRLHEGGPLPFIVLPHRHINSRDSLTWDRTAQFLANRGYGVFQPNYRGSSGYGQRFRSLADGEWGRDIQNDIIDGTEWLIDEGHAEEGKVCIMGSGFAGYAALLGVAKEGDLFSCAIARDAPVDISKMLRDQGSYKEDDPDYKEVAGDLEKKELDQISPAAMVDNIQAPVLLYHREDSYYGIKHMRRFVKDLKKAKKDFDFIEIEEAEGKDLYDRDEDDRVFLKAVEAWLARVNPAPLLMEAKAEGKVAAMPETEASSR